jgi:hypothetical protein
MNNRFRVSSTLPRKLGEVGLSPDAVLRQAGLPTGLFKLERMLVSTEEFFALHRGIAEASNDPAIGLKLGTEERVERYDPIKLAALSASSFRDAIERSAQYKQLTCPEKIRLLELVGTGRRMRNQVRLAAGARARASIARRHVPRMDPYAGTARYWSAATAKESRVSTPSHASRYISGTFPLPGEVQGYAKCTDIQ